MTTSQINLPNPRTWSLDDLITVPRLRADVANAVAFLTQRPMLAAQNNTASPFASGSDATMTMNTELADNWNGHVTISAGGALGNQYWAPVPGWYLCRSVIAPAISTPAAPFVTAAGFQGITGGTSFGPFRGGTVLIGPASSPVTMAAQCCDLIEQTASGSPGGSGDYIQPTFLQGSGSTLNLNANAGLLPFVTIRWVCAISGTQPLPVPPLTAAPSPITAAWLNANARDAIRFLTYPPVCKAIYTPGTATLPSGTLGTPSVVPLTTVTVDNYGGYTTGASAKYTAPVAGVYFLHGSYNLAGSSAATSYAAGLSVNGGTAQWGDIVTFAPAAGVNGGATVTRRLRLNAGDTVQFVASQSSGSAIAYSTSAALQTRFIAVWESA